MDNQYIDPRKHSWASLNATLIGISAPCCMEYKNTCNGKVKHYRANAFTNFFFYSFVEKNRH